MCIRDRLFLNGALYTGALGNAGELGHCTAVENGRPCGCGKRGCLEAHAAGPAITKNYMELGGTPGEDGAPPTAKEIAARARAGEEAALCTFALEGRLLGAALAQAVNILNPARIILGGGVSLAYDVFGPALEQALGRNIYRKASGNVDVMPTPCLLYTSQAARARPQASSTRSLKASAQAPRPPSAARVCCLP